MSHALTPRSNPSTPSSLPTPTPRQTAATPSVRLHSIVSSLYALTAAPAVAERAANFVKSKIPDQLEQYPDTDPAREKALADSVRAGVVDDLPLEEQRQVYDPHRKQV